MKSRTYEKIANLLLAINNCKGKNNDVWASKHEISLGEIMKRSPSGSGIDTGTKLSEKATPDKLVFTFDYHHMDANGGYTTWTAHTLTVNPSLVHGFELKISGPDKNGIKDSLYEVYDNWLMSEVDYL